MLRRLNQLREGLGNFCLWSWYRLRGKSYSEYYARRMDRIVRRNPAWGLNLNREFQLDYLKAKGFLPHHRLLDYGCGALSAGIHFIGYLDADRYVGVDISRAVLEEGLRRVASAGLEAKGPRVHHIDQGNMDAVPSETFDYLWAQSVVTHMPLPAIELMLRQLRTFMHAESKFYFTFARSEQDPRHSQWKDWWYDLATIEAVVRGQGFQMNVQTDWVHPDDHLGGDTMVCAQLDVSAAKA
jgi:ubiquinone/menaquinone biosynthesis C-methylase UbiE